MMDATASSPRGALYDDPDEALKTVIETVRRQRVFHTLVQGVPFTVTWTGKGCRCNLSSGGTQRLPGERIRDMLAAMQDLEDLDLSILIKGSKERYALAIIAACNLHAGMPSAIARLRAIRSTTRPVAKVPTAPESEAAPLPGRDLSPRSRVNPSHELVNYQWLPDLEILEDSFTAKWVSDAFGTVRHIVQEQLRLAGPPKIAPGEEWRCRPHFVYVLQMTNDSYYIGLTKSPADRLFQHSAGFGAIMTAQHGVAFDLGWMKLKDHQQAVFAERFLYRAIKKTGRTASMGKTASNVTDRRLRYQ